MYCKMADTAVAGPWGWERYQRSEEHRGRHTMQWYAEYVIERLGICCRNITVLRDRIEEAEQSASSEDERHALSSLRASSLELLHLLQHSSNIIWMN